MHLDTFWQLLGQTLCGQSVVEINAPKDGPVGPGEKLLGKLEDAKAQALYCLLDRIAAYGTDYMASEGLDDAEKLKKLSAADREKHLSHLNALRRVGDAARQAFWASIDSLFPEAAHTQVTAGIRDDWQVVVWKSEGSLPSIAGLVVEVRKRLDPESN
jgi:hypothetical protein